MEDNIIRLLTSLTAQLHDSRSRALIPSITHIAILFLVDTRLVFQVWKCWRRRRTTLHWTGKRKSRFASSRLASLSNAQREAHLYPLPPMWYHHMALGYALDGFLCLQWNQTRLVKLLGAFESLAKKAQAQYKDLLGAHETIQWASPGILLPALLKQAGPDWLDSWLNSLDAGHWRSRKVGIQLNWHNRRMNMKLGFRSRKTSWSIRFSCCNNKRSFLLLNRRWVACSCQQPLV